MIAFVKRRFISIAIAVATVIPALTPGLAHAQPPPSPQEVLNRARLDRLEFSEAMSALRRHLPQLTTKEELAPYVAILDELADIQTMLDFSVLETSPLRPVAQLLTRFYMPHHDLIEDRDEVIWPFARWSEDEIKMEFARQQMVKMAKRKDAASVIKLVTRVGELVSYFRDPATLAEYPVGIGAIDEYIRLQGVAAMRLVTEFRDQLSGAEISRAVESIAGPAGLDQVLDGLQSNTFQARTSVEYEKLADITLVVQERVTAFGELLNPHLSVRPSVILLDILLQSLLRSAPMGDKSLARAIQGLKLTDTYTLAERLAYGRIEEYESHQLAYVGKICARLRQQLGPSAPQSLLHSLAKMESRATITAFAARADFEGIYTLRADDGSSGELVIARSSAHDVIAVISLKRPNASISISYGLGAPQYSSERGTVQFTNVGTPFLEHADEEQPQQLTLKIGTSEPLEGSFDNGISRIRIKATRQASLPNVGADTPETSAKLSPEGVFVGRVMDKAFRLVMTRAGEEAFGGSLRLGTSLAYPAFTNGYWDEKRGVVYLTTYMSGAGDGFVQVRARIEGDRIIGHLITSSRRGNHRLEGERASH